MFAGSRQAREQTPPVVDQGDKQSHHLAARMIVRGEAQPAPLVFPFVRIVLRVAPIAELGIRGKFLYAWRDKGFGTNGVRRDVIRAVPADKADPRQQQIERQQKK